MPDLIPFFEPFWALYLFGKDIFLENISFRKRYLLSLPGNNLELGHRLCGVLK
jgi:hypothetical protein